MKKRLLSMLMAVLMIVSLVPAVSAAGTTADEHVNHDKFSYSVAKDVAAKQPGIELVVCNEDGTVVKATVVPFAEQADIQKCAKLGHDWKTVELQKASCTEVGVVLTYCENCGTKKDVVVDKDKLGVHVYTDFQVVVEPTCNKEGWGYVVCDNCKNPHFIGGVEDAQAAVVLAGNGNWTAALYKNVTALYAKVNENHADKDAFVDVTKDFYVNDGALKLKAAVKGVHDYATVGGLWDPLMAWEIVEKNGVATFNRYDVDKRATGGTRGTVEYTGDKYCPYCYEAGEEMVKGNNYVEGTDKGSLWTQHYAYFELKEAGYYPYVDDAGDKHDGKTNVIYCSLCKEYFGGDVLPYDEYCDLSKVTEVGQTWTSAAVAPTCCANGATATVWTYSKANANANAAWVITTASEVVDKIPHNFVPATDKAATCTKDGVKYYNYYVCTNVCGSKTYDDCGEQCCDHGDNGYQCQATKGSADQYERITAAHKYEVKTLVAATCTTDGLAVKCCSVCGDYAVNDNTKKPVTIDVDAVPCTAGEVVNAKEATCTEAGYTGDLYCKFCNKLLENGKEIPMVDHTAVDVEAVAPTCTEAGATAGTKCSVCDKVLSGCEAVDALGHTFDKGVCTVCGAEDPDYVAPVAPEFTDAKDIAPYAGDAVAWAVANGIVNGRDDGSFDPKANVTRAELVVMLWRQAGEPESTAKVEFTDAADIPEYAVKAVAWAVEKGIVTGYEDNTFKPTADVTRAEFVKMLYGMVGTKVETAADFSDVVAGEWYVDAINWAAAEEVTTGRDDGTFGVADNATREEAVTFLYRAFAE